MSNKKFLQLACVCLSVTPILTFCLGNTRAAQAVFTLREPMGLSMLAPTLETQAPSVGSKPHAQSSAEPDGQHDFDFEIGTWKTDLRVLAHPLTGSHIWTGYRGTSVVRKVWDGRANLVELEADGPSGHIEGLNLRLYNPQAHQWSLNFADSKTGTLSVPTIGEFKDGRGEFFDQETFNGRTILVRSVWSGITQNSCHFEQAFSNDGGKTWETNWVVTDTRVQ